MRFRKGTMDHDNDGRMGGSRKETDMTAKNSKADAKPEPTLSPKEKRAELNEQFEKADEEGKAAIIEETQLGLQVRGY